MREEMEALRRDMREKEMNWKEEKEELKKCIRELEKKVEAKGEGKGGKVR